MGPKSRTLLRIDSPDNSKIYAVGVSSGSDLPIPDPQYYSLKDKRVPLLNEKFFWVNDHFPSSPSFTPIRSHKPPTVYFAQNTQSPVRNLVFNVFD